MTELERRILGALVFSDVMRASEAAKELPKDNKINEEIERYWGFKNSKDAYREHYSGLTDYKCEWTDEHNNPRFLELSWFIGDHLDIETVADLGSSYGQFLIPIANDFPNLKKVIGVEIGKGILEYAKKFALEKSINPTKVGFILGDETADYCADLVVAHEILEHVPDPVTFLETIERKTNKYIHLSTPFGPWEYNDYHTENRWHLWHFSEEDIRKMVGHKPEFRSKKIGDQFGWHVFSYEKSSDLVGRIDIELQNYEQYADLYYSPTWNKP